MTLPILAGLLLVSQIPGDYDSFHLNGSPNEELLKSGQYFRYIRAVEEQLEQRPSDASLHASLALGYYLLGQQRFSEEEIEQALSLQKIQHGQPALISAQIYYLAARLAMENSRYEPAAKHLQAALQLDPSNSKIEYFLAVCLQNENQQTNARLHFEHACSANVYSWPCRALAEIQLDNGNAASAKRYADAALRIEPTSAEAQLVAGKTAQALGHVSAAVSFFKAAAELDSSWKTPHYLLAHLYQNIPGKATDAARELALFQELSDASK